MYAKQSSFCRSIPSSAVRVAYVGLLALILLPAVPEAWAANRFWTGNGANNNWSTSGNWGGTAPVAGDDLIFQANVLVDATSLINTNNFPTNTVFGSITFQSGATNYLLRGAPIVFTNTGAVAISAQSGGANTIELPIQLNASQTFEQTVAGGPLVIRGAISLNGNNLTNSVASLGRMQIGGLISGAGDLVKTGSGTNLLAGSVNNTYTGTTRVTAGTLELNDTSAATEMVPGALLITGGRVFLTEGDQIANSADVTVSGTGLLDLNNLNETIASLTLSNGRDVITGTGTLTLDGNLTASPSVSSGCSISGNLSLGSANRTISVSSDALFSAGLVISANISGVAGVGFTKIGGGTLSLGGINTYSGLTTVSNGTILAGSSSAFGGTTAGSVLSGGSIELNGVIVSNESLTNNSPNSTLRGQTGVTSEWSSNLVLNASMGVVVETNGLLNLSGSISGTGGLVKSGPGTNVFSGALDNTYAGVTTVNEGRLVLSKSFFLAALTNDLIIGDNQGGNNADIVEIRTANHIGDSADVIVNNSGVLILNTFIFDTIGSLAGDGNVSLAVNADLFTGGNNASTTFSGQISGAGDLEKVGTGRMTLSGTNTYTGATRVAQGTLLVNGFQPDSPVTVSAGAVLGGSGTVGIINNGGTVAPGASPGILTSSNTVFGATANFTVELNGTLAGSSYDQLNVRGVNNLGGATLNVNAPFSLFDAPGLGAQFTILQNDGAEAITGTFSGQANNSGITADNLQFRINYDGGTGNDVVLTLTNVNGPALPGAVASGNANGIIEPNECDLLNVVVSNRTAIAMTGIQGTLSSVTPGVTVIRSISAYPDVPANNRRTNTSPFQILTPPNFICGQNVDLELSLATATHGTFKVPVRFTSGAQGPAVAFSNNTVFAIPDGGTANSTVIVSGIASAIAKVTVSLNITHPNDADLDISLEAPDGTMIELSTDNGASGDNYGNDCIQRTTFDDQAATAITNGAAPFFNTFRPEGRLSDLRGKSGLDVNGTWTLHVTDDAGNALAGMLNCWTLNLSPAVCTNGTGACELCPDVTLSSALGTTSPQALARLSRNGQASTCAAPTICPGSVAGSLSYNQHVFHNGLSDACITVTLNAPTANLFSAAYTNSFNPASLCVNYLADCGDSTTIPFTLPSSATRTYSFNVRSNATFVVIVNEIDPNTGGPYTLIVTGGDCRPVLHISQVATNRVVLDWTTAAAGYLLERSNNLPFMIAPLWPVVPGTPVVVSSRFQVTNTITASNDFYRLRKP